MPQKSYKLSLNDSAGLWRGQSNIALNKSAFDATRVRNKLYFDLAKNMEHVPSLRTQFARLFIKDETAGATQFEDYGLYTQAEVPTKKYLANHGLDRSGFLYKAISFNWEPNELIRNFDDPELDVEAMDTVISCQRRETYMLILNYQTKEGLEEEVRRVLHNYKAKVRSKIVRGETTELTVEVLMRDDNLSLPNTLSALEGVNDVTLVQYRGSYEA